MKDLIISLFKNLSSKKFFACLFSSFIIAVMGVWCLYKLPDAMAVQAFMTCVGSIVAIFAAFATGNVIGDHYGKSNIDTKENLDK